MTVPSLQWLTAWPRLRVAVQWLTAWPRLRVAVQWLTAWPRLRAALIRNSSPARRERRTYRDSFFSDPAAVEDDSRRMRPPGRRS